MRKDKEGLRQKRRQERQGGKFQFEVFRHNINSLAQLLADLESVKGRLSSEEWASLGEILKDISAPIEKTRDDIVALKGAVVKVQER